MQQGEQGALREHWGNMGGALEEHWGSTKGALGEHAFHIKTAYLHHYRTLDLDIDGAAS